MDNLTHTLIGFVAGDGIARSTAAAPGGLPAATRRAYFVTVAAIGSNIPDLDLVLTYGGFAPGKIGYLLHHRGHTHTIIGCVVLAMLLYACAELWARVQKSRLARGDRIGIAAAALLGVLLHLFMDGLNSYGVHPFWPFDNGWVYGDSVFIIEPLYWLAALPLIFTVPTWFARVALALAAIGALAIGFFLHREQPVWILGLVLLAVVLLTVGKKCTPRVVAIASIAVMMVLTGTFNFLGRATAREVSRLAATAFPGELMLDHVLTPVATNPLCWDLLLIQTGNGQYTVRHGIVATAPSLISAENCPRVNFGENNTAPMTPVSSPPSSRVEWLGEFTMSQAALASIVNGSCEAAELMQFARAPFAVERGERQVLGDLRFDRQPELGFAEIELSNPASQQCRFHVPWVPPRLSLLRQLQRTGEVPGS